MQDMAKKIVADYHNRHLAYDSPHISPENVYIVWFSKTLQNWKALAAVEFNDGGMYYEITHNGDKHETYVDVYKKWENFTVKGGE